MRIFAESIFLFFLSMGIMAKGLPAYPSNPYAFPIAERIAGDASLRTIGDQFFAVDLNQDGLSDYTCRSENRR